MFIVTAAAAAYLYQVLAQTGPEPGHIFRPRFREGRFSLVMDVERAGDQVFYHENIPVLSVERELVHRLDGYVLDLKEGKDGMQLRFEPAETLPEKLPGAIVEDVVQVFLNGRGRTP